MTLMLGGGKTRPFTFAYSNVAVYIQPFSVPINLLPPVSIVGGTVGFSSPVLDKRIDPIFFFTGSPLAGLHDGRESLIPNPPGFCTFCEVSGDPSTEVY